MNKPSIVCVTNERRAAESALASLRDDGYALECFPSIDEARRYVERRGTARQDVLLLIERAPGSGAPPEDFQEVPDASRAEELRRVVRELLARRELEALEARNELLELLNDVGVALAGSFDIQTILETTHGAAARLIEGSAVDVLYRGCDAINSRPLWYPSVPGSDNLSLEKRQSILDGRLDLEEERHACYPIRYQDEELGLLFLSPVVRPSEERARLLSILALQAATALRNIHLNQERIHFERLSAIGRMIGSVVHDFRSPLTALRGYAGMLSNLDLDDRERSAYGSFVIDECDRLNQMVSELLEFTRGGSVELARTWVELGPYLDALAEKLRVQFGGRGIRVELHPEFTGEVSFDRDRMERAIWNVATNACQAMPDGGRLVVRTRKDDDGIELVIEDEGTGIPEAVRHRIFEPFFSYGKSEGIGLGMLISRKIVEEHGGEVSVESREGTGTLVSFRFPAVSREPATAVTVSSENSSD